MNANRVLPYRMPLSTGKLLCGAVLIAALFVAGAPRSVNAQSSTEVVYVRMENRPANTCGSEANMSGNPLHWEGQVNGCGMPGTDHGFEAIMPLAYQLNGSSCVFAQDVTLHTDGSLTFGKWHHWAGNCTSKRVPAEDALIGYHNGQAPWASKCTPATFIPGTEDNRVRTYYHLTFDAKRTVQNIVGQTFTLTPLGIWTAYNYAAKVRNLSCDLPDTGITCMPACELFPPQGAFEELVDGWGNPYLRAFVVFKYAAQ